MRDIIAWLQETGQRAGPLLDAALSAAEAEDARACTRASHGAALVFMRRFFEAVGRAEESDDLSQVVSRAASVDHYFERVRDAADLVQAAKRGQRAAACEEILDALREIRLLSGERAGTALGFKKHSPEHGPPLSEFVVHSTTVERASSIFAHGALYSFAECVRRGLLSGDPPGVKLLLDPRRCAEFVIFGNADPIHYAGEKVANAHRKGWIDEGLEEDYQPSVRLFFRTSDLRALPGYEDDGCHILMVRDAVGLDHLVWAVFPTAEAMEAAFASVTDERRRKCLAERCLVAPAECCVDPRSYVRETNAMVVARVTEGKER